MLPLEGIGVLVTRPRPQSAPLCHRLALAGAQAICFPTLEIEPLGDTRMRVEALGPLERFDLLIFVSANAVRHGAPLLEQRRDLKLAAIGPSTARALNQAGYRIGVQPQSGYDSESLLAHPELRRSAGKRVLIVKGVGGRAHLRAELERRGAEVREADVYRRVRARPTAADLATLEAALTAGRVHVVTVTSVEVGSELRALVPAPLRTALEQLPWVVPGARVATALRQGGLAAPVLLAASAEDQAFVEALIRWRESGA
jgi:uroporphyrinogen-III synthase